MKPQLSCAETLGRLDDYLDRELSAQELADVETHLEACSGCAGEFAVERDLLDAMRAKLAQMRIPEDLRKRIWERLARE